MTGSATTAEATAGPDPTSLDRTAGQRARALRVPAAVVAVVLVASVALALALGSPQGYLDPDAAGPSGGRALRVLLEDGGVAVDRVTTVGQALAAVGDGTDQTLVVNDAQVLLPAQLAAVVDARADLVIVNPAGESLQAVLPELTTPRSASGGVRDPACALDSAQRAGRAYAGGSTVGAAEGARVDLCYAVDGQGSVAVVHRPDGRTITVVGLGDAFTNARLGDEGNAALGLGLLGRSAHLTWLVAQPALGGDQPGAAGVRELLPRWVGLALLQLAVVVGLVAVWRGRRFGPLVHERLPVVVRAAEATEGRARLYRRSRARDRAAETLRAGTRLRLATVLGVPVASVHTSATPEALVAVVAARGGVPSADVAALLFGGAPPDDHALVRLVDDLDQLERTVRRA